MEQPVLPTSEWREKKSTFFFLSPSRSYQFNFRIVRVRFVPQTTSNNREIVSETRSHIFTWRSRCRRRQPLLKFPKDTANRRYDRGLHWRRTCIGLEACTCRKNRRVSQLSFRCHRRRYFGRLQFVRTNRSDQPRQLCRTVRAAHSQPVHFWRKHSVMPGTSLSLAALMRSTSELADPAGRY